MGGSLNRCVPVLAQYWMNWMNDGKGLCGFNQQWGSQVPLTQAFCSSFAPAVGNATIRLFEGYNWNAGQYNTPESCAAGQCKYVPPCRAPRRVDH